MQCHITKSWFVCSGFANAICKHCSDRNSQKNIMLKSYELQSPGEFRLLIKMFTRFSRKIESCFVHGYFLCQLGSCYCLSSWQKGLLLVKLCLYFASCSEKLCLKLYSQVFPNSKRKNNWFRSQKFWQNSKTLGSNANLKCSQKVAANSFAELFLIIS